MLWAVIEGGAPRRGQRRRPGRASDYGLNFPKSCGSIFSRYSFSLSASSEGSGRGLLGLDAALVEELLTREDRRPHSERQRDAVGRTGVHLEDVIVPPDQQLGEVGVLLDGADEDPAEVPPETHENLLEEIVSERALRLHSLQLHGDGARLRRADPDGKDPATFLFSQDDDRSVGGPVETEMGHRDFDHDEYFPGWPASQPARTTCPRPSSPDT